MTQYTQIGAVTIQAFQWTGQALSTFPTFAKTLFIHQSGTQLHVPARNGTIAANLNDWVVLDPDGSITCMPNAAFVKLFH